MPAIITATPVIVDSLNSATDFFTEILPYGKFVTGTAAYQVLSSPFTADPPAAFPTSIRVYKTTDLGVTWVEKDTGNRPVTSGLGLWPLCSTFDGRTIYVVYVIQTGAGPFAGSLYLQTFDTSTGQDKWGAPGTPSSGAASQWAGLQTAVVKLSDRVRLYAGGDFVDNIAGVWDAVATTFNVKSGNTLGALVDSLYRTHYVGPSGYQLISAGGIAGPGTSSVGNGDGLRCDMAFVGSDSIAIAWTGASHGQNCKVAIGTPLAAAAFTTSTIATAVGGVEVISYATLSIDTGAKTHLVSVESDNSLSPLLNFAMSLTDAAPANTGLLTVRYILNSIGNNPYTKMQIWQSQFDGVSTWSTLVLFYDLLANPPAGFDPANQQFLETGQALSGAGSSTPVTLACPIVNSGPLGLPFVAAMLAGGGTPPYSYTVTGGALPPGLSLNAATGIISGIPTLAGTYSYTVTVTDSASPALTATVTCSITITKVNGPGGRGIIHFKLTAFDGCLGKEYSLYECIDRDLLSCAKKPDCFLIDERQWGTSNDDDEIIPGAPPNAIAFNPSGAISTPTSISGDNVIFQFRVPIGYDGIILGQFHGYFRTPIGPIIPPPFVEGGGDLVWRISSDGRFVRDCGNMLLSIGSRQAMSPVAGGIQLRSNDLVKYIVAAPNTSGTMAPGQGSIVAGLHGYYWPRL